MRRLLFAAMLAFAALPALAQAEPAAPAVEIIGSEIHVIDSETLGRRYQLFIKLPPGYADEANADRRFPVLYMNDARYTFHVASAVSGLPTGAGLLEPLILVGINTAEGEDGQSSRVRDLTPTVDPTWVNYATGGAPAYLEFLKTEVIAYVESRYRADPAGRTLVGQSLGGSFGAWVLLTEPELFSGYILTSPSLWYHDKEILDLEERFAAEHDDLAATVYLATGETEDPAHGGEDAQDMVGDQARFAAALRSRGYPGLAIRDEIVPDGWHETTFPVGFLRAAQWMFPAERE